jgi:hypothetical protein
MRETVGEVKAGRQQGASVRLKGRLEGGEQRGMRENCRRRRRLVEMQRRRREVEGRSAMRARGVVKEGRGGRSGPSGRWAEGRGDGPQEKKSGARPATGREGGSAEGSRPVG